HRPLTGERSSIPEELVVTAWTADGTVMGLRHAKHPTYGVQFHPASVLTKEGKKILANFIRRCSLVDGASGFPVPSPDPSPPVGTPPLPPPRARVDAAPGSSLPSPDPSPFAGRAPGADTYCTLSLSWLSVSRSLRRRRGLLLRRSCVATRRRSRWRALA